MSKLCSVSEAVARFIPDGASVLMGVSMEQKIPFGLGHEIIRQKKKNLTLIGPISDILFDQLIGAGCAAHLMGAWVGNVMMGSAYAFRRAVEESIPNKIEVVDYTNFTVALALQAAALGVPFLPTYSTLGSDILKSNPNLVEFQSPVSNEKMVAVKALVPDVAVIAVGRADAEGNGHLWGDLAIALDAARAAKTVIVVAEEIVSPEVISSDPNRTLIPGFLVSAAVQQPFGCHPSPVQGYYNRDHSFYREYHQATKTKAGFDAWLEEWVFDLPDREAYLRKLGAERIAGLKVRKQAFSEPVDFGY